MIVRSYDIKYGSEYFLVDNSLSIKNMYQNYLKIEHSKIRKSYYVRLTKLAPKAPILRRDHNRSISHMHVPFVNILGGADVGHDKTENKSE